ncbi:MAG TPA: ABATE domain-containing protein [Pyrinomonadaceae bacterium]
MKVVQSSAAKMKLVGGQLCLDFVNTVDGRKSYSTRANSVSANNVLGDKLENYFDLVEWSRHAGIITTPESRRLIEEGRRQASEAGKVFARAIALREALYRVFKLVMAHRPPQNVDLDTVNDELQRARSHERLIRADDGFTWEWTGAATALDRMLWSIAHSGAEYLTSGDFSRLRECGSEECGWLFEDTSKNRSRQWCHMQDCGNLEKVRRFRARKQLGSKTIPTRAYTK